MNKLAIFAGAILLLLGGAQWYLASNSLTPYVNQQLLTISQQLVNQKLSVDGIAISTSSGTAHVKRFSLQPENIEEKTPSLFIENISFTLNRKSVKKEVINIEMLALEKVTLHVDKSLADINTLKIVQSLSKLLNDSSRPLHSLIDGYESNVSLDNIVIHHLFIVYYEKGEPIEEHIFTDQKIQGIQEDNGLPVSVLMTQVLQKVLDSILINQMSSLSEH